MRKLEEKIFKTLMRIATLVILGSLVMIFVAIIKRGLPAMSWDMLTQVPGGGFYIGKEGGLLNAIAGSVFLVIGATILGLAISIPVWFISISICLRNRFLSILPVYRQMFCLAFLR